MAKSKISVTLDPMRLEQARSLLPTASVSELLDVALARLIDEELDRRHVDGYRRFPSDADIEGVAAISRNQLSDDVDWAALYAVEL